jgi:hypothetical protein
MYGIGPSYRNVYRLIKSPHNTKKCCSHLEVCILVNSDLIFDRRTVSSHTLDNIDYDGLARWLTHVSRRLGASSLAGLIDKESWCRKKVAGAAPSTLSLITQ